jgi:phosphatidylinositol alpha-1,6-mannosyltransferase
MASKVKRGRFREERLHADMSTWVREARRLNRPHFLRQIKKLALSARPRLPQTRKRESKNIKVLWIAPSFFPKVGGLEVYNEKLVQSLANLCDLGLVTRAGQWFPGDTRMSQFTVSPAQPGGVSAWQVADELADIVSCFAPDIVHLGGAQVAPLRCIIPESIPVLATVHGNDITFEKRDLRARDFATRAEAIDTCSHVFAVSEHTADLCREWGITVPISVVTAGCDFEFFKPWPALGWQAREWLQLPHEVPIILTVGRLVWGKGHRCILEAIRHLDYPVHWVVAGDGPYREQLISAITVLNMTDQVSLLGDVFDDDLLALYNACDLFVLTPEKRRFEDGRIYAESFGLVFLEAAACGKPVITTSDSGCRDAVVNGGTGILVPGSDPLRLSRAIDFLLENSDVAMNFGLAGYSFVRASGGWQRLARQTVEKYHEVLYGGADRFEPPQLHIPPYS